MAKAIPIQSGDIVLDELWLDVVGRRAQAEFEVIAAMFAEPLSGLQLARSARLSVASFEDDRWRTCFALVEILHQRSLLRGVRVDDQVTTLRMLKRAVQAGVVVSTWWDINDPTVGWSDDDLYYQLVDGAWWSDRVLCRLFDCYPCALDVRRLAGRLSLLAGAARDAMEHVKHARELLVSALNGVAA